MCSFYGSLFMCYNSVLILFAINVHNKALFTGKRSMVNIYALMKLLQLEWLFNRYLYSSRHYQLLNLSLIIHFIFLN